MKIFISEIRSAVLVTLILAVVCCGLYPLVVFGIGQVLFHDKANGSLILDAKGNIQGSRLLGQQFTGDKYFPRDLPQREMVTTPPVRAEATLARPPRSCATALLKMSRITDRRMAWPPMHLYLPTPLRHLPAAWIRISALKTLDSR
jgi:K+-transporting ATPase c subunit